MLGHEQVGPILKRAVGSEGRAKLMRFVENLTYGAGAVPLRLECMHGAGSPAAQRIVIERHTDWAERMKQARRLAGRLALVKGGGDCKRRHHQRLGVEEDQRKDMHKAGVLKEAKGR